MSMNTLSVFVDDNEWDSDGDGQTPSTSFTSNLPSEIIYLKKSKTNRIIYNLFESENIFIEDLLAILKGYKEIARLEQMQPFLPFNAQEKLIIIFGNLDEIYKFHSQQFIIDLKSSVSTSDGIASSFIKRKNRFCQLYSTYCMNLPRSEELRENSLDLQQFFQICQEVLDHKMPLSAYLIRPVQRLTEYQLILTDLLKYCYEEHTNNILQKALDCVLKVLKAVNDRLYQRSISGLYLNISQQGELLLQGAFSVLAGHKLLSIIPKQRYIFLYQKVLIFCKSVSKSAHSGPAYKFKHHLLMSEIGMTERLKDNILKFEVWLPGRKEVYVIIAPDIETKYNWISEIKKLLVKQMKQIKKKHLKENLPSAYKMLPEISCSENKRNNTDLNDFSSAEQKVMNCYFDNTQTEAIYENLYSNYTDSDNEYVNYPMVKLYLAFSTYYADGKHQLHVKKGDIVELLQVSDHGWWYVKIVGTNKMGWVPSSYFREIDE